MFGLTQIQLILIGGALAVVLTLGGITYIYKRGEASGSSDVKAAVQHETVRATEAARQQKEQTNDKVRRAPLDVLIDGMQ